MVLTNFQDNVKQSIKLKERRKTMLRQFENYLIQRGYKQFSVNAAKSTVFDYSWRIAKICEKEQITLEKLSADITKYLELYGKTGLKWCIGRKSHESYINALKQFRKFVLVSRFDGVNNV